MRTNSGSAPAMLISVTPRPRESSHSGRNGVCNPTIRKIAQ
jgi:hypothetical protein